MSLRILRYATWALVVIAAGAAAGVFFGSRLTDRSIVQTAVAGTIGGPFTLVDAKTGGPFDSAKALAGKPYAIFFGYTHCPDVCPTTLFDASGWLKTLGPDAEKLRFVYVTVDPERDTQTVMKNYLSAFDPRIVGLTGQVADTDKVAKLYRIFYRKVPGENGDYSVDHTATVELFNAKHEFAGTIDFNEKPDVAVQKLRNLLKTAQVS